MGSPARDGEGSSPFEKPLPPRASPHPSCASSPPFPPNSLPSPTLFSAAEPTVYQDVESASFQVALPAHGLCNPPTNYALIS